MQPLWPSLLMLALIAGLGLAAWLLRRGPAGLAARGGALAVLGAVPVGTRERIALVRAGGTWLVVGITSQTITLLAELDEAPAGIDASAATQAPARFSDALRAMSGRASNR